MTDFNRDDSFTQNPLINSIGNAIGLGPLFAEGGPSGAGAAGPPAAAPPPKIAPVKPMMPPNRIAETRESMAVRQHYPTPRGGAATRGSSPGVGGVGMNLPGVMDPAVLQHPIVQQLLGQYGISPEQIQQTVQGASPNMFITNPEAYEKHPMLSGMIERGLEGAAFTKPGATIGENINNIGQGFLSAQAARADKYNNQLMMPFAQATAVQNLQKGSTEEMLKSAQIRYDQAHADYLDQMGDVRGQIAENNASHQRALEKLSQQNHTLAYLNQHKDMPLNDDEQAKLNQLAEDNKGVENVPFDQLQDIYNTATQRALDKKAADALERTKMLGNFHLKGARISADHAADTLANGDVKTQLEQLNRRYAAFQRQYVATRDGYDPDGTYVRGSKAKDVGTKYLKQIKALEDQLNAIPQQMKTPGSVATPQRPAAQTLPSVVAPTTSGAKKKLAYDPLTGSIN